MDHDPIGVASGRERNAPSVEVISAIERIGNDLQITIHQDGDLGRAFEQATVRLTTTDLDRLLDALTLARAAL